MCILASGHTICMFRRFGGCIKPSFFSLLYFNIFGRLAPAIPAGLQPQITTDNHGWTADKNLTPPPPRMCTNPPRSASATSQGAGASEADFFSTRKLRMLQTVVAKLSAPGSARRRSCLRVAGPTLLFWRYILAFFLAFFLRFVAFPLQ